MRNASFRLAITIGGLATLLYTVGAPLYHAG